jgi:hypothetical protein
MTTYRIRANHAADPTEPIAAGRIVEVVTDLSGRGSLSDGRPFGHYILAQFRKPDRAGRPRRFVAVGTAKDSPGRALYGRTFLVERITDE